jgi:hypothetical protein
MEVRCQALRKQGTKCKTVLGNFDVVINGAIQCRKCGAMNIVNVTAGHCRIKIEDRPKPREPLSTSGLILPRALEHQ